MRKITGILAGVLVMVLIFSLTTRLKKSPDYGDNPQVKITMESGDTIVLELDAKAAPISVANFIKLVEDKFYDDLKIHRVVPGFVIQTGDPQGSGYGGSKETITGEFSENGWDNPISHERGVVSMARKNSSYDSATSQFFILLEDNTQLDGFYAAFGRVIEGMDIVDEISTAATDANEKPLEDIVIKKIRMVTP